MEPDEYAKLLTVKMAEAEKSLNGQMYGLLFGYRSDRPTREWFATHPMQRHTVIVPRETPDSPDNYASYTVEVWRDGNRIHAQCGDSDSASFIPGPLAEWNDQVFDSRLAGVIDLLVDGCIAQAQQTAGIIDNGAEPTPHGVGWDDFDWSI